MNEPKANLECSFINREASDERFQVAYNLGKRKQLLVVVMGDVAKL